MTDQIKVFCSHNSVDIPRVKAVAEQLAAAGIDPWWIRATCCFRRIPDLKCLPISEWGFILTMKNTA